MQIGTVELSILTTESNYRKTVIGFSPFRRTLAHNLVRWNSDKAYRWEIEAYALGYIDTLLAAYNNSSAIQFVDRDSATYSVRITAISVSGCTDPALSRVSMTLETASSV